MAISRDMLLIGARHGELIFFELISFFKMSLLHWCGRSLAVITAMKAVIAIIAAVNADDGW